MFNKEENIKIKKIELNKKTFYKQYNNISITPFFVIMLNRYYEDKKAQDHFDLDERIKLYLDKSFEFKEKKQYNTVVYNLYSNGKIKLNDQEYNLKDFYIVYKNKNDFHLLCTDDKYPKKDISYNKSVKFIDTTAFIKLIDKCEIKENIVLADEELLKDVVSNWDGFLHDKVSNTDAIVNKDMIGNDQDE